MGSEQTIDLALLLKPIPGDNPSGRDLKDGKSYDVLKEARREEELLSQGEWKRESKVADWPKVILTATKVLTKESKDVQVACWLLEGLVRKHGFPGLRDGLMLLRGLHEHFWETMYPVIEDGDLEFRSGRLEGLNTTLPYSIRLVPLTRASGGVHYGYYHFRESREVENLRRGASGDAEKKRQFEEALEEGKLEGEKFDKAVAATPASHCAELLHDLGRCIQAAEQLEQVLDNTYGKDAPSLRPVKEAIEACLSLVDSMVKKKGGVGLPRQHLESTTTEASLPMTTPEPSRSGGVEPHDRADALRRLHSVAEFFRRTEPHSPVSYLVQRAAKWGDMPFNEWLQEVIKDEGVLGGVRETLGIKDTDSTPSS